MDSWTIEIEFPTHGPTFEQVTRAVAELEHHLARGRFRVESLVRVHGRLFGVHSPYASQASTYAIRIHLAAMDPSRWQRFHSGFLAPLRQQGAEVRAA